METNGISSEFDWDKIKEIADVHSAKTSTGADIFLICPKTTIGPEALAMIQALYSRDPTSILKHLVEVADKGPEKFMKQYYKEYGHKSIGDCGNILIAFEGVSMLAAKAVQDSQLYAGQEASTRYMDFSHAPFLVSESAAKTNARSIQENWRQFYFKNFPITHEYLMQVNPYESFDFSEILAKEIIKKPELNDPKKAREFTHALWKKTMKARAFDTIRGFLPAGTSTFVAWWTSISHAGDHLAQLRCHHLQEVSELANKTEQLLKQVYPSSFGREIYEEREEYKRRWFSSHYYLEIDNDVAGFSCDVQARPAWVDAYRDAVLTRPEKTELPWQIGEAINGVWTDLIDFGSFRDQQRHRAVIQRMGLLTDQFGIHEWYMENLPGSILEEAQQLIYSQLKAVKGLGLEKYDQQYLLPMGMKVPTRVQGSLSKLVYLIELRCQNTVHPTLHANTFKLAQTLRKNVANIFTCNPEDIPLYINENVGEISLKRGAQDIVKVSEAK